jgi:hypothetical protein
MAPTTRGRVSLNPDGEYIAADGSWLYWFHPEGPDVRVRVAHVHSQVRVRGIWVEAEGRSLPATALRALPLGKLEAVLNDEYTRNKIGLDVEQERSFIAPTAGLTRTQLHERTRCLPEVGGEASLKIAMPPGRYRDDDFYYEVARVYAIAARTSRRPAKDIAEANNVPNSTVYRWMREAKSRSVKNLQRIQDRLTETTDGT